MTKYHWHKFIYFITRYKFIGIFLTLFFLQIITLSIYNQMNLEIKIFEEWLAINDGFYIYTEQNELLNRLQVPTMRRNPLLAYAIRDTIRPFNMGIKAGCSINLAWLLVIISAKMIYDTKSLEE